VPVTQHVLVVEDDVWLPDLLDWYANSFDAAIVRRVPCQKNIIPGLRTPDCQSRLGFRMTTAVLVNCVLHLLDERYYVTFVLWHEPPVICL